MSATKMLDWTGVKDLVRTVVRRPILHSDFLALSSDKRQADKAKDPFVCFAAFAGNVRSGNALLRRSALALDFDANAHALMSDLDCAVELGDFDYVAHPTRSHTAENPRLRVYIPLSRDVTREEHAVLVGLIAPLFNAKLDQGSRQAERIMYLPVVNAEAPEYVPFVHDGSGYLNPDHWLAKCPAPEGADMPPRTSSLSRAGSALIDPLELKYPDAWWTKERVERELLAHFDPSDEVWDRSRWLILGMILHHQGDGGDEWLELWDAWSSRDQRVDGDGVPMYQPGLCEQLWETFNGNRKNAATIGTLIKWVRDAQKKAQPVARPAGSRFVIRSADELLNAPPLPWLIRGVVPRNGLVSVFGASGSGKSFLVLDLACAVASGEPNWFDYSVKQQSAVIYCVLEGEGGIGKRLAAWKQHTRKPVPKELKFVTQPFNLLAGQQEIMELARAIQDAGGHGGLVILDTLSRAVPGADENSSVDMSNIVAAANTLQDVLGGVVMLVHHTGKDASKGLRGHSSLHAALDAAIEVCATSTKREWRVAKSKDDVSGLCHPFGLTVVDLGQEDEGDAITSCVVERSGAAARTCGEAPRGKNQMKVYDAITALFADGFRTEVDSDGNQYVDMNVAVEVAGGTLSCEPRRKKTMASTVIHALHEKDIFRVVDGRLYRA
ncbi:AAA family ATPase [Paraburkholderia sp. GAS334]|uniref:AAA family ATPase n=1 Tax=Paraburkholderia sp. GAS334 TaxID=3035131 RepID=UPI003D244849